MSIPRPLDLYRNLDATQSLAFLFSERDKLTSQLLQSEPLNFKHYLRRAAIHYGLGYSDLTAGDAYKALTLLETYFDPDFSDFHPELQNDDGEIIPWPDDEEATLDARRDRAECLRCLVLALIDLGCLPDAHTYLLRLEELDKERGFFAEEEFEALRDSTVGAQNPESTISERNGDVSKREIEPARLRSFGFARREIYRWNYHEPDRTSSGTLDALNGMLKPAAPNLEVRAVELPVLKDPSLTDRFPAAARARGSIGESSPCDPPAQSLQLGLFAKTDLPPSSAILYEPSVLTAVRPINAPLCYNCGVSIPDPLSTPSSSSSSSSSSAHSLEEEPTRCPSCTDAAVFCSRTCLNIAQARYHQTTCGNEDIDPLGRDETSENPSEDLYFLLLARAFAMSHASNTHPSDLPETKYLCGVYPGPPESPSRPSLSPPPPPPPKTLPFTFHHTILLPFRLLSILSETHPSMSPFSPRGLDWYDTWVIQTLYAKFRGVASARQSTWDGKPEVAAVHPLWCLTNHSCAPNVEWGWGRERAFRVRERERGLAWREKKEVVLAEGEGEGEGEWKGIRAGEEILSHYCDVELEVGERRKYMLGSLGGECMCERCVWEAGQGEGGRAGGRWLRLKKQRGAVGQPVSRSDLRYRGRRPGS